MAGAFESMNRSIGNLSQAFAGVGASAEHAAAAMRQLVEAAMRDPEFVAMMDRITAECELIVWQYEQERRRRARLGAVLFAMSVGVLFFMGAMAVYERLTAAQTFALFSIAPLWIALARWGLLMLWGKR